ncbi:MAG: DUF1573 domain-containing protein [Planctomycetota bacterium]
MIRLVLAALVAATLAVPGLAQGKPSLELSSPGWDFGERLQGEVEHKAITIKNVGRRKITAKVTKTCGCIGTTQRTLEIEPGTSVDLQLELDTKRGEGEIKKFVLLETDDPVQRLYSLPMTGVIHQIWSISTYSITLDRIHRGPDVVGHFDIRVRKGHDVKITGILSSTNLIATEMKELPQEDGSKLYRVELRLEDKIETGYFEDVIVVTSDDKDFPQRAARVSGEILTSTTVSPDSLAFGLLKPGVKKTMKLTVSKPSGDGLRIVEVTCEDDFISTAFHEKEKGRVWEIEVTIDPKEGQKDVRGTIRINYSEPGQVITKVNYYGRVLLP